MNFKIYVFLTLFLCFAAPLLSFGEGKDVERRLEDLEHKVQIIDANQLNYRIEKDLLRETYSNNYETINLFITIVLGLVAIFGYLGIRDISKIKEKYESELAELRRVKDQFEQKSSEFDVERKKIDEELKTIIKENQEQSQKIQFIELKEKALSLLKENNLTMSLEFTNAALDIKESDTVCLHNKGRILERLNQLPNALQTFRKSVEDNPEDPTSKYNLVECLCFMGQVEEAESIIEQNKDLFESKLDGKLIEFFNIIKMYFESDLDGIKNIAKSYVQHDNLDELGKEIVGWDFREATYFAYFLEDNDLKTAIQNIIWYLDNQIKGKILLTKLKLPLPVPPEENNPDNA